MRNECCCVGYGCCTSCMGYVFCGWVAAVWGMVAVWGMALCGMWVLSTCALWVVSAVGHPDSNRLAPHLQLEHAAEGTAAAEATQLCRAAGQVRVSAQARPRGECLKTKVHVRLSIRQAKGPMKLGRPCCVWCSDIFCGILIKPRVIYGADGLFL